MRKKMLSLILAALMLAGTCLTGCGEEGKEKQNNDNSQQMGEEENETQDSQDNADEELEEVTLKVWLVGTGKQKDSDTVWEYFNEQLKDYLPNTTVEFTAFSFDEYATKWSTAMASGETVDLAWFGWVQNLNNEIEMGTLTPLGDLVETYCQDAVELFGKEGLDMHRSADGELYVFPCWQGLATAYNALSFQADTVALMEDGWLENFQQMCYEYEDSFDLEDHRKIYDELTRYFETCKENGMLKGGIAPGSGASWNTQAYANGSLGDTVGAYVKMGDNTFQLYPYYTDELVKLNWEYIAKWYDAGYIRQDIASMEKMPNEFTVGDPENSVITYTGGAMDEDVTAVMCAKYDMDIVSVRTTQKDWMSPSPATCWCIPSTTSNAERAAMLLNLLNGEAGKELYQTLVYGIEGVHYTKNADGTATTLCGDGQANADWAYGQVTWVMGNVQNCLVTQSDTEGMYEYRKSRETEALQNPLKVASFSMDVSEIEAQFTNLKAIYKKYADMFNRGYLGEDGFEKEYANFQKELIDAGIESYYEEFQRQVDELVAARGLEWAE